MNRPVQQSALNETQLFTKQIWRKNLMSSVAFVASGVAVALLGNYAFPMTVKSLIDIAEHASKSNGMHPVHQSEIIKAAMICIGVYLVRTASNSAIMIALYRSRQKTLEWIRMELLGRALDQQGNILSEQQPAEMLTRINQDSVSIVQYVCQMPQNLSINALSIIISLYFIAQESWTILGIALLSILALLLSSFSQNKRIKELTRSAQELQSRYMGHVSRAIAAWKTIRIFKLNRVFMKTTRDCLHPYLRKAEEYQIRSQLLSAWAATMLQLIYIIYLGFAAYLISRNQISFGTLVAVSTLLSRLSEYARNLVGVIPDLQNYRNALANVRTLMERQNQDPQNLSVVDTGVVCMDSFHFEYDKNKILIHASLDIATGEKVVVTGANGSGKSTLISILLGIFKGQGYLLQPAYQKISAQLTPQSLLPVPLSEQLNSVARENGNEELLQELITELELEALVERLPDTLSAGQLQKFTILLCLLKRADLYLFDEPLANIALSQRQQIFAMILQRLQGKTAVCVMHEGSEILAHFDRIITLDRGQFYSRRPEEKLYAKS